MRRCYVCASSFQAEASACTTCQTPQQLMDAIDVAIGKHRFLFGSVKIRPEEEPAPPPQVRRTVKKAKPQPEPKRVAPQPSRVNDAALTAFQYRDIMPERAQPKPGNMVKKGLAYLLDVVFCSCLNAVILGLVLVFSERAFAQLVTFSLIPLLFVLLSFTLLYFWLFMGLFNQSLGQLTIADKS